MAIGLENYPNIEPISAAYPSGSIKDRDGATNGTPVNRTVYTDIHQFFARLLRARGVTPNGNADNDTNGYQLFDAFESISSGTTGDGAFNVGAIGSNCVVSVSENGYSYNKIGRKVEILANIKVTVVSAGVGNFWFNPKITTSTNFKPEGLNHTLHLINTNAFDNSKYLGIGIDGSGNFASGYDNDFVAVVGQTYLFRYFGSYFIPNLG